MTIYVRIPIDFIECRGIVLWLFFFIFPSFFACLARKRRLKLWQWNMSNFNFVWFWWLTSENYLRKTFDGYGNVKHYLTWGMVWSLLSILMLLIISFILFVLWSKRNTTWFCWGFLYDVCSPSLADWCDVLFRLCVAGMCCVWDCP